MFGGGFNFSGVALKGLPPGATGLADNGLSIDPVTGNYVLGNDVGGSLAKLLSSRDIPLNSFLIRVTGSDNGSGQLNAVTFFDGFLRVTNDSSVFGASKIELFDNADSTLATLAYGNDTLLCTSLAFVFQGFTVFNVIQNNDAGTEMIFQAGGVSGTDSTKGMRLQQIWGTTGTPTLFLLQITDNSSNANSLILDAQVSAVSKFRIRKDGQLFIVSATASLNFPNTAAQTSSDLTIAYPGAGLGDMVTLGVPNAAVNANSCYTAFVSSANVVTVRFNNYSAGAIDPAAGNFTVSILKTA